MIYFIFIAHFIGDFILQSREIANNKSSNIFILSFHCIIYSLTLFCVSVFIGFGEAALFALINGVLHFVVDYVTSKLTTYYYTKENSKMFFNIVGLDQLIHYSTLIVTYEMFLN